MWWQYQGRLKGNLCRIYPSANIVMTGGWNTQLSGESEATYLTIKRGGGLKNQLSRSEKKTTRDFIEIHSPLWLWQRIPKASQGATRRDIPRFLALQLVIFVYSFSTMSCEFTILSNLDLHLDSQTLYCIITIQTTAVKTRSPLSTRLWPEPSKVQKCPFFWSWYHNEKIA